MSWDQTVVIRPGTPSQLKLIQWARTYPDTTPPVFNQSMQWRRNPGANANANADQNLGKFSGGMG